MDEKTKREQLASILKMARVKKKMTQKELAEKCNFSESTIKRIEEAKFSPRLEQLYLIVDTLDIKIKVGNQILQ